MRPRGRKRRIGDMLLEEKMVQPEQLEQALAMAKENHRKIGEVLVELGYVTEEGIAQTLSKQLGIESVNLREIIFDENVLGLANGPLLRKHVMIPFAYVDGSINVVRVAMADPMDMTAIDDFCIVTNLLADPVIATPRDIMTALDRYYGNTEAISAAQQYAKEREQAEREQQDVSANEEVNHSPIVRLVNTMIEQAGRQRASDIHIEALEKTVRVRFRIDGALYEKNTYDIHLLPGIMARIKIIGGMDISEKRKPQDGRITMMIDRKEYDIRVSILPTVYGEKCVMRLTQKRVLTRNKAELGFSPDELSDFDNILKHPNGILLVTGPTGSGKSTTLYTALSELNKEDVNIITVEDPVEANIDGVNQVQVNTKAEMTFANALRSILRQDPDIIMIGEIRDAETAEIAVQASITGHLVVSTLHTNSAAGTITRLLNMGVESYLLADSMIGIIAQRLVRKLCTSCREEAMATGEEKRLLGQTGGDDIKIYRPRGCPKCNSTGYTGRIGIYEIMKVTPELKSIISRKGTTQEISGKALEQGMKTLRMSAVRMVLEGTTSIQEMLHVTYGSE